MNNIRKKITTSIILTSIIISSIFAKTEIWVGTGFISHGEKPSAEEKDNYWIYHEETKYDNNGNEIHDNDFLNKVIFVGPSLDLSIFPYYEIPIGVKLSTQFLFPCGYNNDSKYRSYNFDYKNRNFIGLSYAQSYNSYFGLFAELGYEFDTHRIATSNIKNNKLEPDYNKFNNHSLYCELGFLTTIEEGYFKFGINYSHSIINKASSSDLIFTGGFRF